MNEMKLFKRKKEGAEKTVPTESVPEAVEVFGEVSEERLLIPTETITPVPVDFSTARPERRFHAAQASFAEVPPEEEVQEIEEDEKKKHPIRDAFAAVGALGKKVIEGGALVLKKGQEVVDKLNPKGKERREAKKAEKAARRKEWSEAGPLGKAGIAWRNTAEAGEGLRQVLKGAPEFLWDRVYGAFYGALWGAVASIGFLTLGSAVGGILAFGLYLATGGAFVAAVSAMQFAFFSILSVGWPIVFALPVLAALSGAVLGQERFSERTHLRD